MGDETLLRSVALHLPHGFLTAPQSDSGRFDLIRPDMEPVLLKQVHSARVVEVDRPFPENQRPEADAMVSATPGTMLAIVTADCAPVLFADLEANDGTGVIGAAHAGWRGGFGGVLENTVAAMVAMGARAERIVAVIGPTIAQASYEVDTAFHDRLVAHDAANIDLLAPGAPGHYQFNLPAYIARRLSLAGVGTVDDLAVDTYAHERKLYSFRRATHRGAATGGRQFSALAFPA